MENRWTHTVITIFTWKLFIYFKRQFGLPQFYSCASNLGKRGLWSFKQKLYEICQTCWTQTFWISWLQVNFAFLWLPTPSLLSISLESSLGLVDMRLPSFKFSCHFCMLHCNIWFVSVFNLISILLDSADNTSTTRLNGTLPTSKAEKKRSRKGSEISQKMTQMRFPIIGAR